MRVLAAALSATAITLAASAPARAEIAGTVPSTAVPTAAPAPDAATAGPGERTAKLTIENAQPAPIPARPDLKAPSAPPAPPKFKAPTVLTAPPLPEINVGVSPAPPPPPAGAPPVQPPKAQPSNRVASPAAPPPAGTAAPPASQPQAAKPQTAALPPPASPASPPSAAPKMGRLSIGFDASASSPPDTAATTIGTVAERMRANPNLRLQLRAFAGGTPETAREARQLSLARALGLRERLGAEGIASTRVDIRAIGLDQGDGAPDRVDMEFLNE